MRLALDTNRYTVSASRTWVLTGNIFPYTKRKHTPQYEVGVTVLSYVSWKLCRTVLRGRDGAIQSCQSVLLSWMTRRLGRSVSS